MEQQETPKEGDGEVGLFGLPVFKDSMKKRWIPSFFLQLSTAFPLPGA